MKPVERRLQVGILSIDGGTNGIGILGTRSGTGQSWGSGYVQSDCSGRSSPANPGLRAVNDPISVLAHGGRTKRISFFPFAEMMVFRHTILDRPTTLLFGDWMLDCRCYPVVWAPSVKVHVQQKVMDLSLIHQKNTTLVGSILYRFCDFRWAPVVKIPHLLIVLLHLLHAEIVFSTFFHQRGFQTSGCNSDGGGETSVDSWLGATKTTTALLGPRHIFWCHNPLKTGAKGTPVRSNSNL